MTNTFWRLLRRIYRFALAVGTATIAATPASARPPTHAHNKGHKTLTPNLKFESPTTARDPAPVYDSQTLQTALAEAQSKNLSHSPHWLKLLRYRQSPLTKTYASEIDGLNFFIHPRGKRDPDGELVATLQALLTSAPPAGGLDSARPKSRDFMPANPNSSTPALTAADSGVQGPTSANIEAEHPQCKYMARRRVLWQNLSSLENVPQVPCPRQDQQLKQLQAHRVSLVFASAYMGNPASMFGHTFLKLHLHANSIDRDLMNYGINFAAETDSASGAIYAVKGLTGGFRGKYSLLPYHLLLSKYTFLEGRDLWEYELTLTADEIQFLFEQLLEFEKTHFDYYFLDENCSYHLLTLLEATRPGLSILNPYSPFLIPADSFRQIIQNQGLVREQRFRPSLKTKFNSYLQDLDATERNTLRELVSHANSATAKAVAEDINARVLDAAITYGAIKEITDPQNWSTASHPWKLARARLGRQPPLEITPSTSALGHPSSTLRVGAGSFRNVVFSEFEAMPAYHPWLAPDAGFLANSQMEILRVHVRHYSSQVPRIEEFKLFDIVATNPWNHFFQPLSWRLDAGLERPTDLATHDQSQFVFAAPLMPSLRAAGGATFQIGAQQYPSLSVFLLGHGQAHTVLTHGYRLGIGPQAALNWRWTASWKMQLLGEQLWYGGGQSSELRRAHVLSRWFISDTTEIYSQFTYQLGWHARGGVGWYF
jgi:hypothetical protein